MDEKLNVSKTIRVSTRRWEWVERQASNLNVKPNWILNRLLDAALESGMGVEEWLDNIKLHPLTARTHEDRIRALEAALKESKRPPPDVATGPPVVNDQGAREGHGGRGRG